MLSINDKKNILLDFPNIKLSYENIIHKKVYSNYYVAIPEGEKCFAWFTTYQNKNVCFIINLPLKKVEPNLSNNLPLKKVEPNLSNNLPLKKVEPNLFNLSENPQFQDIKIMNSCFNSNLCYETIFYGTHFNQLNNSFFSIEDIFYYKGKDISNFKWIDKLLLLNNLMKNDIKQISYNNSFIVFGLPLMNTNLDELNIQINNLKYKINSIHFKMFNKNNTCFKLNIYKNKYENLTKQEPTKNNEYNNQLKDPKNNEYNNQLKDPKNNEYNNQLKEPPKNEYNNQLKEPPTKYKKQINKKELIFKIKPDIQNDIYHLYCNDKLTNDILYFDVALIPDFKTSVLMNKLFRNIKENYNLDALEESDDEDFENENRFVFLDKEYNMICLYNYKFKKWYPIKLASKNQQIVNFDDL